MIFTSSITSSFVSTLFGSSINAEDGLRNREQIKQEGEKKDKLNLSDNFVNLVICCHKQITNTGLVNSG